MPGSGTIQASPAPPGGVASQIVVCKYDDNPALTSGFYTVIPNVECIGIQRRKGADPGVARFRYRMGNAINPSWPDRFQQVFPLNVAPSKYVVQVDDELVVLEMDQTPSGMTGDPGFEVLFHGLAEVPQANISATVEEVTFQAIGIAATLWENPIGGAIYRDGPDISQYDNTATDRPTRFNPDGRANSVKKMYYSTGTDTALSKYPLFLDPTYKGGIENATGGGMFMEHWTISSACRYLLWNYNKPADKSVGEDYVLKVENPDFDLMTTMLDYVDDPANPDDYTIDPIPVEDYDATGDPLPVAIEKLITPYKRAFYFQLDQDRLGRPITKFVFYRTDDSDQQGPVDVYLADVGGIYDPSTSNAAAVAIHREADQIVNVVELDTELVRYEASFILAPGFTPNAGDTAPTVMNNFTEGNANFTGDNLNKYRLFIFDESGEGHWKYDSTGNAGSMVTTVASLDDILGKPKQGGNPGLAPDPVYSNHRRPGLSPMFTRDALGAPLSAQLWVSTNYTGTTPGVWDGTGDWQEVTQGGWELLKDRLGIRITHSAVIDWNIGKTTGWTGSGDPPSGSGLLNLINSFASTTPASGTPPKPIRITFRLTCVIESDQDLGVTSNWYSGSTTLRAITRRIDARDRFKKHVIMPQSSLSISDVDVTDRDDTQDAQYYADAIVHARACAQVSGTIMIPRITAAYDISDPVASIDGRDVSLQVNQGVQEDENKEYPYITGIDYNLDGEQKTILHIHSDHTEVPLRRRR